MEEEEAKKRQLELERKRLEEEAEANRLREIELEKKRREEADMTPEEIAMKNLGLPLGFQSTKGKQVPKQAALFGVFIKGQRKFKQYMNKKPVKPNIY